MIQYCRMHTLCINFHLANPSALALERLFFFLNRRRAVYHYTLERLLIDLIYSFSFKR